MYIILSLAIIIYIFMIILTKHRTPIALIGAGAMLILGALSSIYNVNYAFSKFPGEIILLIIVLSLFTDAFNKIGLIDYIGYTFVRLTKENKVAMIVFMPLLMYATSLFMNNLTVVLLYTYMGLYLFTEFRLPVVPLLVSIVIGSNIGGAALPWADTPAVILTLYTNFNLLDFVNKLMLPCALYIIALSIYNFVWYKYFAPKERSIPFKTIPQMDKKRLKPVLLLFVFYIFFISIGPFVNISIAYTSLFFGGLLLLLEKRNPIDILNELPIMDSIVFIIALFLIGGILEECGILKVAAEGIIKLTSNNAYLISLAILFLAFIISTFLSAGPAAATLLPICQSLYHAIPFKLIYAALALGILAGSSMLPWSATGGPILLSQANSFIKQHDYLSEEEKENIRKIYNLKSYVLYSVPFSLTMLAASAVYIIICIWLQTGT